MKHEAARILTLPVSRPALGGATRLDVWRGRITEWIGRSFNRLGIPGAVRDVSFTDSLTGQEITVHIGVLFTRLTVNGRDYYFHRLSGKHDGSGMGCG